MAKKKKSSFPLGIILLCKNFKLKDAEITLSWMKTYLEPEMANVVAIIPPTQEKGVHSKFNNFCKTYRSKKDSDYSMINKGMQYTQGAWNLIITSGNKFRTNLHQKLFYFATEETDILYPVTTDRVNFFDSTLNWLYIHRNGFDKVGEFPDLDLEPEYCRILWAAKASESGCQFKGISGLRI